MHFRTQERGQSPARSRSSRSENRSEGRSGDLVMQGSTIAMPMPGMRRSADVDDSTPSTIRAKAAVTKAAESRVTLRAPDIDLDNALVEGERYGYRYWARWACR